MRTTSSVYAILLSVLFGALADTGGVRAADTLLIDLISLPYSIHTIAGDSAGTIWLSGARGLEYYDFEQETFILSDPSVKSNIIAKEGRVVPFRPQKDLGSFPWDRFQPWLSKIPPGYDRVSVAMDKFGHYWVSTGSVLFIFSIEDRFQHLFPGYSTRGIFQDKEGLYINTYLRGILKNGEPLFERPSFAEGEIKRFGKSLYFGWAGLIRYEPHTQAKSFLRFKETSGPPLYNPKPIVVHSLDQIRDTIWVGTNFGLGFVMNDSVVMVSNYPNVEDVVDFQDGLLIAGSSLLHPGKAPPPRHDLPEPTCGDCKGIYLWQKGQLRKLNIPEFNYYQITKVAGNYYFASDSGLVVWDGSEVIAVITTNDGLTNNRTCTMAMDEEGFLWVSTLSGLNRIQPATGKITQYLRNIEFNYRSVYQSDRLIYMGSIQGVYAFNPKHFIGDEIEPPPGWSVKKILLLSGLGMILFCSIAVYFINRYYQRKARARSLKLAETEKKLFLLQIEQLVFRTDMAITVSNLADALEMSERTLYRSFKEYDLTPGAYLKELKLKKAKHLLNGPQDQHSLKEVAQKVGYTEQYLSKLLNHAD